jgi:hypothetical protein
MLGVVRGTPEDPCCAMITERIACTKRARRAGIAAGGVASSFTSSGGLWPEVRVSGFAGGIGDGERVLGRSVGWYDVGLTEKEAV